MVKLENNDRRSVLSYGGDSKYRHSATGSPELKAMAYTPYRPKSVFIHTLKRTESIAPETYIPCRFIFVE